MGIQKRMGFCPRCSRGRQLRCFTPHHGVHLLLSLVTVGLWVPIWMMLSVKPHRWQCSHCGHLVETGHLLRRRPADPAGWKPLMETLSAPIRGKGGFNNLLVARDLIYYLPTNAVFNGS